MRWLALYLLIIMMVVSQAVCAFDFAEKIQIHGFISQGYFKSSNNNFLVESRSGSAEFTEVALNANLSFWQDLRLGAQAYYRNLGDYSEDKIVLDWGIVEYRPLDALGLRLGKCKMPHGLYNETRDSGFLRPMIFLPQSIYDESRRDTTMAFIGADLFGNVSLGRFGDIDYHLFTGQAHIPDESMLAYKTKSSIEAIVARNNKLPLPKRNVDLPEQVSAFERESEDLYGGSIVLNDLLQGLRLSATLLHSKSIIKINNLSDPVGESVTHTKYVLSAEYSSANWLFVGEYGQADRTAEMFGKVSLDGPSQSWYVMACYTLNESWSFSLLYDEFYRLKHDHHSSNASNASPGAGWRKDMAAGVRYDLNDNCCLKAEYHYVDGTAMQLGAVNPDGVDRYWSYVVAKISVSF